MEGQMADDKNDTKQVTMFPGMIYHAQDELQKRTGNCLNSRDMAFFIKEALEYGGYKITWII